VIRFRRDVLRAVISLLIVFPWNHGARAFPAADRIDIDLNALIDASAPYADRFAVDVPQTISPASQGRWNDNGVVSTWTYTTRIDTAVSMSFHASRFSLPPSAALEVSGTYGSVVYRARDANRGGLWARPLAGDTISISLSVKDSERSQIQLAIASFQAGYRSLGHVIPDNPHYQRLVSGSTQSSSCTLNYSCEATTANQGPAKATVAIVVNNVIQCTGTLLNDANSDGTAYVLTARHCENGVLGGGLPNAAASITVYWDAVTPCGQTLASIYDGAAITQSGATTVVEQQDAWLIQLDDAPAATDAFYAGWDATGGVFSGGYSVHHALGYDKQFVGWFGQSIAETIPGATLKIGYSSTFWGVVNQSGSVGAGASGGALFDPDNRVVGSATLAQLVNGANSAGICPAPSPPAPSASTATALYTSLSAVWSSTSDATSTTGSATLQSVLDSTHTGNLVMGGASYLPVTLTSSLQQSAINTGQALTLSWSAPGATACTASGGLNADGWAGPQAASGSIQLTEQSGGNVTYSIACTANGRVGGTSVVVYWQYVAAIASVTKSGPTQISAGTTFQLNWYSTTQPCTASGGVNGDGWTGSKPNSGSQNIVETTLGSITYTITCGSGARVATGQITLTVVAPFVSAIVADANQLRIGQIVNLQWSNGGYCVASGGAPGDGWAGSVFNTQPGAGGQAVTETTAGTYTYTLTCTGGGLSASNNATLTFVNASPMVTMFTANPAQVEVFTDPGASATSIVTLNWAANVRPCSIAYAGPGNLHGQVIGSSIGFPRGSAQDSEEVAGSFVYTITCGVGQGQTQATATVNYYTTQPAVTLNNVPNPWPLAFGTTIAWSSNVFPCTATGGTTGDGWAGALTGPMGNQTVTESQLGTLSFGITCGSGSQIVQAQASTQVITPTVTMTANATSLPINQALDLSWSANFGSCSSSGGPGGGGWGNLLPAQGGFNTTSEVPGTFTYTINCAGAQASTQVTFTGTLQPVTLTASAASSLVNGLVTLTWNWSAVPNSSCTASGGIPGDGWNGGPLGEEGSKGVTSATAGTVAYSITCTYQQLQSHAQTQVTYMPIDAVQPPAPTPSVTLTASASNETVGSDVKLSWSSENASACTASGGASGDGWSGTLPLSGSMSVTESSAGSFAYSLECSGAPPAAAAMATVNFTVSSSSSGAAATGGGGGGGGAMEPLFLLILSALGLLRWRRGARITRALVAGRPRLCAHALAYDASRRGLEGLARNGESAGGRSIHSIKEARG
jgi:hypothetical protein